MKQMWKICSSMLTKEIESYIAECNFTEDEEIIFRMLTKGKSRAEISRKVGLCDRATDKRIAGIRYKMEKMDEGKNTIV